MSWWPQRQYFSNYFFPNSYESLRNEVLIVTLLHKYRLRATSGTGAACWTALI